VTRLLLGSDVRHLRLILSKNELRVVDTMKRTNVKMNFREKRLITSGALQWLEMEGVDSQVEVI